MSIQIFLASGLLESYVLDQCSPSERITVERMLAQHEEVRRERTQIESVLNQYATAYAIAPPAWMRGRILDNINNAISVVAPPLPRSGSKLIPVALGISTLLLAGLLYLGQQQHADLQQRIQTNDVQIKECLDREMQLKQTELQMAFLTHPQTRSAKVQWLDPARATQGGRVTAYNNETLGKTVLKADALPALRSDQDYQFWVITDPNKPPIPLKVFNASANWADMAYHAGALKFAVSVEPKGGSPNGLPTTVIMLGELNKAG